VCGGPVYVALADGVCLSLAGDAQFAEERLDVSYTVLDDEGDHIEYISIRNVMEREHVEVHRAELQDVLKRELRDGAAILERAGEVFPRLRFGATAADQLEQLNGKERWYSQLLNHLRALNQGAENWREGSFEPDGALEFSVESQQTLKHGSYGPQRDFPVPEGAPSERFSLHSKIRSDNKRIYFLPYKENDDTTEDGPSTRMIVVVGYIGVHLLTVYYPT